MQKQYSQVDEKAVKLSRNEEHEAVELYEHRLRETKDRSLKRIFKHVIKEELEHKRMFESWLEGHEKKENGIEG